MILLSIGPQATRPSIDKALEGKIFSQPLLELIEFAQCYFFGILPPSNLTSNFYFIFTLFC